MCKETISFKELEIPNTFLCSKASRKKYIMDEHQSIAWYNYNHFWAFNDLFSRTTFITLNRFYFFIEHNLNCPKKKTDRKKLKKKKEKNTNSDNKGRTKKECSTYYSFLRLSL